ncbi:hypothetical protein, partial [Paenibacillus sp. GbtcB18]|uniref:hypothetical protein n=1 Tax=Paenibacillus sp. GbtcB18 TaxID=2824763 RepID=UPI001C2F6130
SDGGMTLITRRQNEAAKRRFMESVSQNSKKNTHTNEKEGKKMKGKKKKKRTWGGFLGLLLGLLPCFKAGGGGVAGG